MRIGTHPFAKRNPQIPVGPMKTSVAHFFPRSLTIRKIGLISLALCLPGAARYGEAATVKWNVNSGDWLAGSSWITGATPGVPGSADRVDFELNAGSGNATAFVNVAADANITAASLYVGYGKDVELTLGQGSTLNLTGLNVGFKTLTTSAAAKSSLKIVSDDPAELNMSAAITVGADVGASGGNRLEFSGPGLKVSAPSVSIGRFGDSSQFTLSNGAKLTGATQIWMGATTAVASGSGNNNKMIITGPGTRVEMTAPGALALVVATRPLTGLDANIRQTGNVVDIAEGAVFSINNTGGTSRSAVQIGAAQYRSSNRISVTGAGSLLELKGNIGVDIGYTGSATWDNYLEVKNGGVVRNEGNLTILGNRSGGPNNRLIIDNGTYISESSITVGGGDISIINGGKLLAQNGNGSSGVLAVTLASSANTVSRFLIGAGSEVSVGVNVVIQNKSVLALTGSGTGAAANAFRLNSAFKLESGAVFETSIFGGEVDNIYHIDLASTGSLQLENGVVFKLGLAGYTAVGGESWQVFTGNTAGVTGGFDIALSSLPALTGGLGWDLTRFNEAGSWTIGITPVPEPSTYALIGFGVLAGAATARRKARKASAARKGRALSI